MGFGLFGPELRELLSVGNRGSDGSNPFSGLSEDDVQLLRQINLIATQFGLSAEAATALLTASSGGLLSESQAGRLLLGLDGAGGGTGRVQFPSEAALDAAQTALLRVQAAELQKQNAFERARDRIALLQATDQLQEARRENAISALLQAAPLMVAEGTEFTPGFEPAGPAMQLSNLVGANLQPQRLPQAQLPLQEFLNAPTTVTPETIDRDLLALVNG